MFQPTEKDRQWLAWAVELAEDAMLGEPDEFGDGDFAALEAWKAVASVRAGGGTVSCAPENAGRNQP